MALLIATACKERPSNKSEMPTVPVEVVNPEEAYSATSDGMGTRYPAKIMREREVDLSFRVGGTLTAVPAHNGDRLNRGALVAQIDATPVAAELARIDVDIAKLKRADERNRILVPAGAVAPSDAEDLRSAISAAQAARRTARYELQSSFLRMPFPGVVLARDIEVGSTVSQGMRIARVADLSSPLIARVSVPASVAQSLASGRPVTLTVGSDPREVSGTVRRIGAVAEVSTGSVAVDVVLPYDSFTILGATGSAALAGPQAGLARNRTVLTVPVEALLDSMGSKGYVFVAVGEKPVARRRPVEILSMSGDRVAVLGLRPDARVITAGAGFVSEGQSVLVTRR